MNITTGVELETEEILFKISDEIESAVTEKLHAIHEEPQLGGKNYNKLNTEEQHREYLQSVEDYAALVRFNIDFTFGFNGASSAPSIDEMRLAQVRMVRILIRMVK